MSITFKCSASLTKTEDNKQLCRKMGRNQATLGCDLHKVKKSSTKSSTNLLCLLFLVEVPCFAIPFELLLTNVHAPEHSIPAAAVQQQAEALTKMLVASNWTWGELVQMHPEYSSTLPSYTYRRIVKMWVFLSQSFWCGQCKYVCSIHITYHCLYKCYI